MLIGIALSASIGALRPKGELGARPRPAQCALDGALCRGLRRENRREQCGRLQLPLQGIPAEGSAEALGPDRGRRRDGLGSAV